VLKLLTPYGPKVVISYLEYLVKEAKNQDGRVHTELVCIYVQVIIKNLDKYFTNKDDPASLDKVRANQDEIIFKFRKSLNEMLKISKVYDAREILSLIPNHFLQNEKARVLAKQKKYKKALILCI